MGTQKPEIVRTGGFWLEWFRRRSELEVNVYVLNKDGTRGEIVSELAYPKIGGPGDWTAEAISIAKNKLKEKSR